MTRSLTGDMHAVLSVRERVYCRVHCTLVVLHTGSYRSGPLQGCVMRSNVVKAPEVDPQAVYQKLPTCIAMSSSMRSILKAKVSRCSRSRLKPRWRPAASSGPTR